MLQLRVNGTNLDMGDTKLLITFENPLFSQDGFQRDYTFNFKLPATPKNNAFFRSTERLDTAVRNQEFICEAIVDGIRFIDGILTLKESGRTGHSCFVQGSSIDFIKNAKQNNLSDIDLLQVIVNDPADPVATKIANWNAHLETIKNFALEEQTHVFPLIKAVGQAPYYEQSFSNPPFSRIFNDYDPMAGLYKTPTGFSLPNQWDQSIVPMVRVKYLIEAALEELGFIGASGDVFYNSIDMERLVVFANKTMDQIESDSGLNYNVYVDEYNLKDYLPDMTYYELLIGLRDQFNLFFPNKDKELIVLSKNEVLESEIENISNFFSDEYSYKWVTDGGGFTVCYPIDEDDSALSYPGAPIFVADFLCSDSDRFLIDFTAPQPLSDVGQLYPSGSNRVELSCLPLYNDTANRVQTKHKFLSVSDAGSGPVIKIPRFAYYRGVNNPFTHPYATAINFSSVGFFDGQSLSMNADHGNNVYEQLYVPFLNILNDGKEVKRVGHLSASQVMRLIDWTRPRKQLSSKKGNPIHIVKSVRLQATAEGIGASECTFVTES